MPCSVPLLSLPAAELAMLRLTSAKPKPAAGQTALDASLRRCPVTCRPGSCASASRCTASAWRVQTLARSTWTVGPGAARRQAAHSYTEPHAVAATPGLSLPGRWLHAGQGPRCSACHPCWGLVICSAGDWLSVVRQHLQQPGWLDGWDVVVWPRWSGASCQTRASAQMQASCRAGTSGQPALAVWPAACWMSLDAGRVHPGHLGRLDRCGCLVMQGRWSGASCPTSASGPRAAARVRRAACCCCAR